MPEINDIFISYGRAESQYFASKLNTRLMEKGLEVWFDQEDIPLGVDFQEQIYDGIEKSKNFVYIIAPHSIKSEYCTKELQHAIYLKKRIIPILHIKPLLEDEKKYLLPEISKLNWIFFREEFIANVPQKEFKPIDDFEKSFAGLLELIGKDSEYLTQHTQYLVRAMEWEKSGKKKKNLLRIEEIEPAQKWSDEENYKEKPPVFVPQILKDYIRESKKSKYLLGVQSMDAHKDMFISYSRRSSLEFVWDVFMELTDKDYEIWFDQNDIPLGVDFQEQINSGIVNADAFIYVISPTSIRSEYCLREIKLAAELGKRIIPILHVMPSDEEMKLMHPVIEKLNWVYMQQGKDDVKKALFDLRKLLSTHKEYVEQHTVILKSAIHWDKNQRATQQLLVGNERQVAEDWLRTDFSKEQPPCLPSDLMCEFIAESKKNANNLMTEVFIAYDVDDLLMRDEVNKYLIRHGFTTWVHQSDIKAGVDYGKAIELGIEQADNLLFLISPRSVKSKYCMVELNYALSLNKRVIPIQIEPTEIETFPPELKQIQFIDFTEKGGKREDGKFFDVKNLQRLVKEINKDKRYFEEHKAFQNQALKWIRQNRNSSILLRGYNLDKAKTWLKEGQKSSYPPTQLHEEFINESIANIGQLNTEVFISYSRTDGDFARKLNEQFQLSGKTTWFDQESIASGADFQKEIYKGIEQADNFVFVISPEAVRSQYCADEVEYAGNLNKRFVTILYRPTDPAEIHPLLASVQWIDFSNKEFPTSYNELLRTIDIDRDYVQSHTKWSQLGVKWIENNRDAALLLRGSEFALADSWLKNAEEKNKNPRPTSIQQEFISESHAAIVAAERRKKRGVVILRFLLGLAVILLIVSAIVGLFALQESKRAKVNAEKATASAKIATENALKAEEGEKKAKKAQSEAEEYARQAEFEKKNADNAKKIAELRSREALIAKDSAQSKEKQAIKSLQIATYNKLKADTATQVALEANNRATYHLYVFNAKEFAVKSISIQAENQTSKELKALMSLMAYELKQVADTFQYDKYFDPEILEALQNSYLEYEKNDMISGETWGVDITGKKIAMSTQLGEILFADISFDQTVKLPQINNFKGKTILPSELVKNIQYNSNGTISACGTSLGNVYFFNNSTEVKNYSFPNQISVAGLDFAPNKNLLLVSNNEGYITFFDMDKQTDVKFKLNYVLNSIVAIDNKQFASAGSNGTIGLHTIDNPQNPVFLYNKVNGNFRSIDYSEKKKWIIAGNSIGELICIENVGSKTSSSVLPRKHRGIVSAIKFSDDGKWLATGGLDGIVMIWYIENISDINKLVPIVIENKDKKIISLTFDSKSKYLTYGDSKNLRIVPLSDEEVYAKLNKILNNKQLEEKDWTYYKRGNLYRPNMNALKKSKTSNTGKR